MCKQERNFMYHILVVDDSVVNLKMARFVLERDYKVSLIKSGEAALSLLRHVDVDLILMDIEMPDMDGIETVTELMKEHPNFKVPVIFFTSHTERDVIMRCLKVGMKDYIVKPFDPEALLEKVRSALNQSQPNADDLM